MQPATAVVADLVANISACDELEADHIATTLAWLHATDDIFRRHKPATPSPHLVAYTALIDPEGSAIYLGHHRKAGLHLPMGGHVDPGEHPLTTARRETTEELGIEADLTVTGDQPLFLTVTTTVGRTAGHVDVSLWYVIRGYRDRQYRLDPGEFDGGHWWHLDTPVLPPTDPHLPRFLRKLQRELRPEP